LEQPQGPSGSESWFSQFPAPLQEVAMVRLIAALGAGGVIYLTPLVFHQAGFSAAQVTSGLALAALAGTGGRLLCGALLDRGLRCSVPVLLAAASAMAGDTLLALAHAFPAFAIGQGLLGIAAGLYWPASELAVPLTCPPVPSARAFVLVRTADAAGIALGALAGAALAAADRLRGIYGVDIACLLSWCCCCSGAPCRSSTPTKATGAPSSRAAGCPSWRPCCWSPCWLQPCPP
jgi:predicted MFS family arabinose efflux permease